MGCMMINFYSAENYVRVCNYNAQMSVAFCRVLNPLGVGSLCGGGDSCRTNMPPTARGATIKDNLCPSL